MRKRSAGVVWNPQMRGRVGAGNKYGLRHPAGASPTRHTCEPSPSGGRLASLFATTREELGGSCSPALLFLVGGVGWRGGHIQPAERSGHWGCPPPPPPPGLLPNKRGVRHRRTHWELLPHEGTSGPSGDRLPRGGSCPAEATQQYSGLAASLRVRW